MLTYILLDYLYNITTTLNPAEKISKEVTQVAYLLEFVCFYIFKQLFMPNNDFNLQEMKQIDIVDYLDKLGYQPQKIRNNDYWFLSPMREQKEASFKVNRKLNLYYDHGTGRGGSIIDFGTQYHKCSIPEFLQKLSQSFSFHRDSLSVQQPGANTQGQLEALEPKIKMIAAKPLTNPTLCHYLQDRKIPIEIAKKYCKEVDFEVYDKNILL